MSELFQAQSARILAGVAHELCCKVEDLQGEALVVVEGPAESRAPGVLALAVCSGLGTVVSVPRDLMEWARANAPKDRHFRALQPFFLAELAAEAAARNLAPRPRAHGYSVGFALAERHAVPTAPAGLRMVTLDRAAMDRERETGVFDNALGSPDETHRSERMLGGLALLDDGGEPVAMCGWWDDGNGNQEIGVDVRREHRGRGLARLTVIAATHTILDAGQTPFYSCGATNIRSHRNAISCGFSPVFLIGMVASPPD